MKIEINNSTEPMNYLAYINKCFTIVYFHLLVIGTIGNLLVIFVYTYKSRFKNHTTFLGFVILAIIHLVLLYLSSFDFIQIDVITNLFVTSKVACSVYNIIYRSFLLLEQWYII
jgi:hypothetical protein